MGSGWRLGWTFSRGNVFQQRVELKAGNQTGKRFQHLWEGRSQDKDVVGNQVGFWVRITVLTKSILPLNHLGFDGPLELFGERKGESELKTHPERRATEGGGCALICSQWCCSLSRQPWPRICSLATLSEPGQPILTTRSVVLGTTVDGEVGTLMDKRSALGICTSSGSVPVGTAEVDRSVTVGI